jgi:4-amino-4-deoxy-L-arabinose transferase-like glycosyltransferase
MRRLQSAARRWLTAEGAWAFLLPLALYLTGGAYLAFGVHVVMVDTFFRLGNAYWAMFSRDPHLAAIGFVWSPLPAVGLFPLLPFKTLLPGLVENGYASNIQSSLFMAGAVFQLRAFLGELGLRRPLRLLLTVLFALHPMIAYYGMNGMSEALLVFFLILAARCLTAWMARPAPGSLIMAGLALAAGYLSRYEALAAGLGAAGLVITVSYLRTDGTAGARRAHALADGLIVTSPLAFVFAGWAAASWLTVGTPFAQYGSAYGNSAQHDIYATQITEQTGQGSDLALSYILAQLQLLERFGVVILAVALLAAIRRRDSRVLAPLAVLGASLAFSAFGFLSGQTFGWLRFYILAVPLTTMLAGCALAPRPGLLPAHQSRRHAVLTSTRRGALVVTVCALLAAALPTAGRGLLNGRLAREEHFYLSAALHPEPTKAGPAGPTGQVLTRWNADRAAARYLDSLHLPPGSVLLDTAFSAGIVLYSKRPAQFVITSDRDFDAAIADPAAAHVRYLLTVPPDNLGRLEALNHTYPGIYDTGAGIGTLVASAPEGGDRPSWRLYQVATRSGSPVPGPFPVTQAGLPPPSR